MLQALKTQPTVLFIYNNRTKWADCLRLNQANKQPTKTTTTTTTKPDLASVSYFFKLLSLFIFRPLRWKQKTTRQKQIGVYLLSCIWVAWLQTTSTAFTFLSITKITNPVLGKRKHAKCRFDTGRADWSAKSIHTSNDNCFPWLWEIYSIPFLSSFASSTTFLFSLLLFWLLLLLLLFCSVVLLTILPYSCQPQSS